MSDELTPEERFAYEDEATFVQRDVALGSSMDEIVAKLVRLDWQPDRAREYVRIYQQEFEQYHGSPEERSALVTRCFRQMVAGALLTVIGILLSVMTLLAAIGGVGSGIIFVGFIFVGVVMLSRGYSRWSLYRRDDLRDE